MTEYEIKEMQETALDGVRDLPLEYICKHRNLSTLEEIYEFIVSCYKSVPCVEYLSLNDLRKLLEDVYEDELEIGDDIIHVMYWKKDSK